MDRSNTTRIGHFIMVGVFIAVAMLMFLPNIILWWETGDLGPIHPSDRFGTAYQVEDINGDSATMVEPITGDKYEIPLNK